MNPYINRLAGFKGGFIAFFQVEGGAPPAGPSGTDSSVFIMRRRRR